MYVLEEEETLDYLPYIIRDVMICFIKIKLRYTSFGILYQIFLLLYCKSLIYYQLLGHIP